jgi:hypothetical protein
MHCPYSGSPTKDFWVLGQLPGEKKTVSLRCLVRPGVRCCFPEHDRLRSGQGKSSENSGFRTHLQTETE